MAVNDHHETKATQSHGRPKRIFTIPRATLNNQLFGFELSELVPRQQTLFLMSVDFLDDAPTHAEGSSPPLLRTVSKRTPKEQ